MFISGDVAILIGRTRRRVDVCPILCASAGASSTRPRPGGRSGFAARRDAATSAAAKIAAH